MPEWILEAPSPPENRLDVWEAFHILSDSRSYGMSPGPIPLTEIESYLRVFGIVDRDQSNEWIYLIRIMDREYLKITSEQNDDGTGTRN